MIDLLRPIAGSDRYEAVRVRAEVDTGSAGSVDLEDVALEPTNVLRVRVRARDDLDRSWFARVFGEYYKVTGFRRSAPSWAVDGVGPGGGGRGGRSHSRNHWRRTHYDGRREDCDLMADRDFGAFHAPGSGRAHRWTTRCWCRTRASGAGYNLTLGELGQLRERDARGPDPRRKPSGSKAVVGTRARWTLDPSFRPTRIPTWCSS